MPTIPDYPPPVLPLGAEDYVAVWQQNGASGSQKGARVADVAQYAFDALSAIDPSTAAASALIAQQAAAESKAAYRKVTSIAYRDAINPADLSYGLRVYVVGGAVYEWTQNLTPGVDGWFEFLTQAQVIAAINAGDAALSAALGVETQARESADDALGSTLGTEIATRAAQNTALDLDLQARAPTLYRDGIAAIFGMLDADGNAPLTLDDVGRLLVAALRLYGGEMGRDGDGWLVKLVDELGSLFLGVSDKGALTASSLDLFGGQHGQDGDGYLAKLRDTQGNLLLGITGKGQVQIASLNLFGGELGRDGDGWFFKIRDLDGRVIFGITEDGGFACQSPTSLAAMEQARYIAPDQWRGAARVFNIRAWSGLLIASVADAYGLTFDVRQWLAGSNSTALVDARGVVRGVLYYGQSNAMADSGLVPSLVKGPLYPHDAVMPDAWHRMTSGITYDPTSQVDILPAEETSDETGYVGDSPANLFAWSRVWRERQAVVQGPGTLIRTVAQGGQPITQFVSGTVNYTDALGWPSRAPGVLAKYGRAYEESLIVFVQGESGPTSGYQALLAGLLNSLPADVLATVRAAGGAQTLAPRLLFAQTNDQGGDPTVALAQLAEARLRSGTRVGMFGPMYHLPIQPDGIHATSVGRMMMADTISQIDQVLEGGTPFDPLWPVSASLSGAVITINFNKPIQIDTDWVPAIAHLGFVYADGSGSPPAITNVAITGASQIQITLASAPTGSGKQIRYACNDGPATAGWMASRGQIRSVETFPSAYAALGYAGPPANLHHYCVRFVQDL